MIRNKFMKSYYHINIDEISKKISKRGMEKESKGGRGERISWKNCKIQIDICTSNKITI